MVILQGMSEEKTTEALAFAETLRDRLNKLLNESAELQDVLTAYADKRVQVSEQLAVEHSTLQFIVAESGHNYLRMLGLLNGLIDTAAGCKIAAVYENGKIQEFILLKP